MDLTDGQTIDRSALPTGSLVFAAVTNPAVVGSIRISVPALNDEHTENGAPYTSLLFSASQLPDQVEISAQAHTEANLQGIAGPSVTIRIRISDGSTPSPTPTPTPGPQSTPNPNAKNHYVSPTGSGVACTIEQPCSLLKVFSNDADNPIRPGDTVYFRGGRYFINTQSQVCTASLGCIQRDGTADAPIAYRSYPGELATIDTQFNERGRLVTIVGDYTILRDLEITMSDFWEGPYQPECSATTPSNPAYIGPRHHCGHWTQGIISRGMAIDVQNARGVKIINNIIHDTGMGLFAGVKAPLLELYGNIMFYNGGIQSYFMDGQWTRNDAEGHAIYVQNDEGMRVSDNIFFANYNLGIQAYGSNVAPLKNMTIDRNISYAHGSPVGRQNPNLLIGSGLPTIDGKVRDNHMFRSLSQGGGSNCQFGYYFAPHVLNESMTVTGNRCVGGSFTAQITSYKQLTFTGNHIYSNGATNMLLNQYDSAVPHRSGYVWNNNKYINPAQTRVFENFQGLHSANVVSWRGDFSQWKAKFPTFDRNSTFSQTMPTQNEVVVYPNEYEPGRANIVIYNWSLADKVQLDLSSVLLVGDRFEIRNAEKMLADSRQSTGVSQLSSPLVSGVWNGPIEVDVSNLSPSIPVGHTTAPVLHGKEFIVLVVQKR